MHFLHSFFVLCYPFVVGLLLRRSQDSRIIEKLRHLLIFNFFCSSSIRSPDTFDITLCGIVFLLLMVGNELQDCLLSCH